MSWGLFTGCDTCKYNKNCKDAKYIKEALDVIGEIPSHDGHIGRGSLTMNCSSFIHVNSNGGNHAESLKMKEGK